MMQLLPPSLKIATRDTLMAARQTFSQVSAEYLETIIVQRCEFDEAAMGSAIPMDAGGVEAHDDAGSLGQRGVGPGLGKGGARRAPVAPTVAKLPPGGTGGWEKYNKFTNNGFPPNTCGGCGADDHYRNDCPQNPNRGKYPPREKGKGKGKGRDGKGKGRWAKGVDDEEVGEGEGEEDAQQEDEGGSVWEDDVDCTWAVSDAEEEEDYVCVVTTGAKHFIIVFAVYMINHNKIQISPEVGGTLQVQINEQHE